MKLAKSTIFAAALAGGFCLTAYVTAQQPGGAGSGAATSLPATGGPAANAAQPQNTIGPLTGATIGPTTAATIGPTTSATIGPTTSATIGPITSATIGPTTGPAKSGTTTKKKSTKHSTSPKE